MSDYPGDLVILRQLQTIANMEITTSLHYLSRACHWKSRRFKRLGRFYRRTSDEERGHFVLIAKRMEQLGGDPEIRPENIEVAGDPVPLKDSFGEDLAGELAVAAEYVGLADLSLSKRDYRTLRIAQHQLKDTEDHVDLIRREIEKLSLIGEENYLTEWM